MLIVARVTKTIIKRITPAIAPTASLPASPSFAPKPNVLLPVKPRALERLAPGSPSKTSLRKNCVKIFEKLKKAAQIIKLKFTKSATIINLARVFLTP